MSLSRPYKLPIPQAPRVISGYDFDTPTVTEYDEVVFDYRTNRYLTLSQQKEIYALQDEIKKQKEEKKQKLKNIIGYFYKKR